MCLDSLCQLALLYSCMPLQVFCPWLLKLWNCFLVFLKVTLKHSGSLFLYSGDNGGAYAKNSYGNLYVYLSTHAHLGQSMPIGMIMQIWKYLCLPLVEELAMCQHTGIVTIVEDN
jgi:hypothetical protein